MNVKTKARDFITDFLIKELVGPSSDDETLERNSPPRQRYGAGILFPMRSQLFDGEGTTSGEEEDGDSSEMEEISESQDKIKVREKENRPEEVSISTDRDIALTNQFSPSTMGITALVEIPSGSLVVDVATGVYKKTEIQGEKEETVVWKRRPFSHSLEIDSRMLLEGEESFEKAVLNEDGKLVLGMHIVSRPYSWRARTDRLRLITFTLINRRTSETRSPDDEDCFFQCGFKVRARDGDACFLCYPERGHYHEDDEERSFRLLNMHHKAFAVGHGCAPEWDESDGDRTTLIRTETVPRYEVNPVLPKRIEGLELRMLDLASEDDPATAHSLCVALADSYGSWIEKKEWETEESDLSEDMKETARKHMENCRECLRRIREGVDFLARDPEVLVAFRLMNEAMLMQHKHYEIFSESPRAWKESGSGKQLELDSSFKRPDYKSSNRSWRPFQLAFILMNIKAVADPECDERSVVDVIWFPTGGGKTEAYLGLSAFTMFHRRIRDPSDAGTAILMRYTLRLLTTQQFQRAASLVCACEFIRRRDTSMLGEKHFSIGLWVGGEVTPNSEEDAVASFTQLQRSANAVNKFVILNCPWCGADMGQQKVGTKFVCKGYRKLARPSRVRFICGDGDCDFSSDEGLPLSVIDEHIYKEPPTLLIGTVDKFAMLVFRPEARKIFGIDTSYLPPELIIQDELHLISGPLGSMVGHYETVIDALCMGKRGGKSVPPKIVASTATASRSESQVEGLYGRKNTFLFPPQALKSGDSFFAEERMDEVGRLYVGVFANALSSHLMGQIRTMGALLQAAKVFEGTAEEIDPYWTLVGYFNSIRELGRAVTLVRGELLEFLNILYHRLGKPPGKRRFINRDEELTSRVQSSEIPEILKKLFVSYDGSERPDAVDVCFATSMIQVGIDIQRLSLMTIVGQPKMTSEYIQASSRVGRAHPGIVVAIYNPFRPRDRSHYEHFRSYHQSIYRNVEPASVTPFAMPVRERSLHALIVILCRFWDQGMRDRPLVPPGDGLVRRIKETILRRVDSVDPEEKFETEKEIELIVSKWAEAPPSEYGGFGKIREEIPLMYPAGGQRHENWDDWPFATPSSMRHVDASCSARPLRYKKRET